MIKMKTILLSVSLTVVILQLLHVVFAGEACNEYVDGILRDLKEDKEYFQDPYEIEEKTVAISKKVLLINYTGEAKIYDGDIYGMSSLHRDGEVVIDKKKNTHLKIWLGAGELNLKCSGKVKLMGHGPDVNIDAKIVYVNMKLDIVPTDKGTNPKVSNFNIEDVKGLEVKTSGLGPLNFFLNSYIKILGGLFRKLIHANCETKLKTFLAKKLKKYEIPEACLNEA